jgi:hypothetical protein
MKSAIGNRPLAVNLNGGRARAWQVLAFATAQKYPSDINKRLANVQHDVGKIRQFLFENHESEKVANYDYLRQVTSAIATGELSPEDVIIIGSQLEDIERQCSGVMEHSYRGCQRTIDETKAEHSKNIHNLESFIQYSQQRGDEFQQYGRMSLLALSVRIVATYLRATLPLNKMVAHNRVEHLRRSVEEFDSFRRGFGVKLRNTCDTMDAVFGFEATIEESKCLAKSKISSVDEMLAQHRTELGRAIAYVEQQLCQADGLETSLQLVRPD